MIDKRRLRRLNDEDARPDALYVLYWMQQSQRAETNPALEYAVRRANELGTALIVGFGLTEAYPEANERHYAFMLEGLAEVANTLQERQIKLVARRGRPDDVALALAENAAMVVTDRGYLSHQRRWRDRVGSEADCLVVQVEGDLVVPVEEVSGKVEFAARTIRPKLQKLWPDFLGRLTKTRLDRSSLALPVMGDLDVSRPGHVLAELDIDRTVKRSSRYSGGTSEARRHLTRFLRNDLSGYADARNDPSEPQCSRLSPYLHFGQISPVEVANKVTAAKSGSAHDRAAYLEELIVRRELAANFVYYHPEYDGYSALPDWARKTLAEHRADERPERYTRGQLERGSTHDRYWNAAMREMRETGYMHNYMRMYWGKKILEWSGTPEDAHATALFLNNKYFLDGRDPSSYANVGWLFGLHDRPWKERSVFGKVRYMNAAGLERKFNIEAYCGWAEQL